MENSNNIFKKDKIDKVIQLPVKDIKEDEHSIRKEENKNSIEELCKSIKIYGILQPISVKKTETNRYELIAGHRRLSAAKMIGLTHVPAVVIHKKEDSAILSLIENLQRKDLNFFEEAKAYDILIRDNNYTQEELSASIGKSQPAIANKLRLLKLSPLVKNIIIENNLSERHARALLKVGTEQLRLKILKKICEKSLSVKKTEELVEKINERLIGMQSFEKTKITQAIKDIRIFLNTIKQAVDLMKKSGIDAKAAKIDNGQYVELIVRIPKKVNNA